MSQWTIEQAKTLLGNIQVSLNELKFNGRGNDDIRVQACKRNIRLYKSIITDLQK